MSQKHPNSELLKCPGNDHRELRQWDQRIPNEPILARNELIYRPPIIPTSYPPNTNPCIAQSQVHNRWTLETSDANTMARDYWCNHLQGQLNQGVPITRLSCKKEPKLNSAGNEPWIHGTNINIDAESRLRRLHYYNPHDCINDNVLRKLAKENKEASINMYDNYYKMTNNFYPNLTRQWRNNSTKQRNTEPADFDLTAHLMKCSQKK